MYENVNLVQRVVYSVDLVPNAFVDEKNLLVSEAIKENRISEVPVKTLIMLSQVKHVGL